MSELTRFATFECALCGAIFEYHDCGICGAACPYCGSTALELRSFFPPKPRTRGVLPAYEENPLQADRTTALSATTFTALNADQPIVDSQGNIYVLSVFNDGVFKYTPDGRFITRFGSVGDEAELFDNASALALDRLGNVYIAESDCIHVFDPNGKMLRYMSGDHSPAELSAVNV